MTKETEEQAFPFQYGDGINTEVKWECGMTLRDYFAGQALAGILLCEVRLRTKNVEETYADNVARNSYDYADAMLEERLKRDLEEKK